MSHKLCLQLLGSVGLSVQWLVNETLVQESESNLEEVGLLGFGMGKGVANEQIGYADPEELLFASALVI